MENKKGGWQMKIQLSNTGKRKAGRDADANTAPGRRGGTQQGAGVGAGGRAGATHDTEHGDGPAGGWHRGNSLMPQRAFCRGTRWGQDLCSSSGWFTGVLWSLWELGWNPAVPRKSLPKLPVAFTDFIEQWPFRTLGIWLIKGERNWGKLNSFHPLLSLSDLQVTHRRQDSGSEWKQSEPWVSDTTMFLPHWAWEPNSAAARGCWCHLPATLDSWDTVRHPEADLKKRDKQVSIVLPMGLDKTRAPAICPEAALGFPRGEEAAGHHPRLRAPPWAQLSASGAQPCQGSAAHASAHFLQVTQKSKTPAANNHV